MAKLHGLDLVRYTARQLTPGLVKAPLQHLPAKIAETGLQALIIDTLYRLLELVPMHLRLPYIQIWNVLHFDFSGSTPLALYSWPHQTSPEALARNDEGLQIVREIRETMLPIAESYAKRNVRTAPQIELLKRASLCITHAGLNTALQALAQGVPMVANPDWVRSTRSRREDHLSWGWRIC